MKITLSAMLRGWVAQPRLARILQGTESSGMCSNLSIDAISSAVWDKPNWNWKWFKNVKHQFILSQETKMQFSSIFARVAHEKHDWVCQHGLFCLFYFTYFCRKKTNTYTECSCKVVKGKNVEEVYLSLLTCWKHRRQTLKVYVFSDSEYQVHISWKKKER